MQRVLVLGSGGAGKTTFSLALSDVTGLPVIHLDRHFWAPGWVKTPDERWAETVTGLVEADTWIMDGNYGGTLDVRLAAADTVVFLDTPRLTCLARIVKRRIAFHGRSRPSLPEDCPERITHGFVHWIWTYPSRRRPTLLATLDGLRGRKSIHVLRTIRDQEALLDSLRGAAA